MINRIAVLGSTGSIGTSTLNSIKKNNKFKIILLSANQNIKKLLKQSIGFKVKDAIIESEDKYFKYKYVFKKKGINLHLGINNIDKIINKKLSFAINSISGIDGLEPTLKIIPLTDKLLIANKESIICAWELIQKKLDKFKTKFIPLDSEHFSIWKLIRNEQIDTIDKIILTASGGPFLNKTRNQIYNIKPRFALKHPNWKMGKKISIDSATMMNKIFELIEAKKIFNLKKNKLSIIIHPSSYVHAIVFFKGNIVKLLSHDTKMSIPISNALEIYDNKNKINVFQHINKFNSLSFLKPKVSQFPLLKIINLIPNQQSYFETILITINDHLVHKYLSNKIKYNSIQQNLLTLMKSPYLRKFYKLKPKNIYDIKRMIEHTNNYIKNKIKNYDK